MPNKYPSAARRYFAALLDLCFIIFMLWVVSKILIHFGYNHENIETWKLLLPFMLYEPILSSQFATVGQLVFSFRVRKISEVDKAAIWQTIPRAFFKYILGFISFLTMPARADRRAIHDIVTNTIVVEARQQRT